MRFYLGRVLLFVYLLVLVVLIAMPAKSLSLKDLQLDSIPGDYVAHCLAFLPWMLCAFLVWGRRLWLGLCFFLGCLAVVGLECLHLYIPSRGFEWHDMLAGFVGLCCSLLILLVFRLLAWLCCGRF